ncbi:MAG: hypothetical protein JW976_04245 [Syntrophaceae bacterium]|nr:hypothetical protein [Syntrophaceae bacterium]
MKQNSKGIRFSDLRKVCDHFFGEPRKSASSHRVYKTPWQGDPRINIQNYKGKAKAYQVKQVLLALEKLEVNHGIKK